MNDMFNTYTCFYNVINVKYILMMGKIERNQRVMIIQCMQSGSSEREVSGRLGIAKTSVHTFGKDF